MATRLRLDHDLDPNAHRLLGARGADVAFNTSGDLSLGQGNFFRVSAPDIGHTTLSRIATANWLPGSWIDLQLMGGLSVAHGTASGGGFAGIATPTGVDVLVGNGMVVRFNYSGDGWVLHSMGTSGNIPQPSLAIPLPDIPGGAVGTDPTKFAQEGHQHPRIDPAVDGAYLYPALLPNPLLRAACRGLLPHGEGVGFSTIWVPATEYGPHTWKQSPGYLGLYNHLLISKTSGDDIMAAAGDRLLAWSAVPYGDYEPQAYGIYEVVYPGSLTSPAIIRRAYDTNAPAGLCHGMVAQIAGPSNAERNGDWLTLDTADPIVVDTTELSFSFSGTAPTGDRNELLTGAQLITEGASSADADTSATASAGSDGFLMAFETMAGTPGASAIPAAPWTFDQTAVWLESDPGGDTTLRVEVYKEDVGFTSTLLFTAVSPPIHATAEAPLSFQFGGVLYSIAPTDRLNVFYSARTTSTTPVTMHLRYNSATRGTRIKTPLVFATPGTLDHQLLFDRDAADCHPSTSIKPAVDTASESGGWLTFAAKSDACRIALSTPYLSGLAVAPFEDLQQLTIIVTNATPSVHKFIVDGASVSGTQVPLRMQCRPDGTGQGIEIKQPTLLVFRYDAVNGPCLRLQSATNYVSF